jgi:hypothetical protein
MDTHTERALAKVRAYFQQAEAADVRAWAERAGIPYGTARSALIGRRGPTAETLLRLESAIPKSFRIPRPAPAEAANG